MDNMVSRHELSKTDRITESLENAYNANRAATNAELIAAALKDLGPEFTTEANIERVLVMIARNTMPRCRQDGIML
jgi:hypothetical protein